MLTTMDRLTIIPLPKFRTERINQKENREGLAMIIDKIEENGIEVMFSYFPAWEMFFSMHVLAQPDHHMGRRKWSHAVEEKNPRLTEEIRDLQDLTGGWTLLIDIPAWDTFRQMEIPELLVCLRRKNIYEWNEMILPFGRKMDIRERDRILDAAREYYQLVFEREEMLLRPYIRRILKEEREYCAGKGLWNWCRRIHPRLVVREDYLTYLKNREYTFRKKEIQRIYASVSTFVVPHLWLYKEGQALDIVKGIQVEQPEDGIPEDMVRIFKALANPTRLKVVKLLLKDVHTIQELSGYLSISEAGVFKHLKALDDAGLVKKKRRGAYVEYHFQTEIIDFIPYTFYEIMG